MHSLHQSIQPTGWRQVAYPDRYWPDIDLPDIYQAHQATLKKKHLHDAAALNRILHHDLERMDYALGQVQTFDVDQSLHQFFGPDFGKLPAFIRENRNHRLNHMGLEIYTPLDVWLSIVEAWQTRLSRSTGTSVTVMRTARFPSSSALQTRVGASVEILCVWFRQDNQKRMIELFDIGRPIPVRIRDGGLHWVSDGYADTDIPSDLRVVNSFKDDLIWHYAIDVQNVDRVDEIHETFMQLAINNRAYRLAYIQPVMNRHDGSYHTKIIHEELGMELEFATHDAVPA